MWSRFVLGFLLAITTLITESDGETVKTPLKSKADIFTLLLNQETLIRSSLEKKVIGLVKDVLDMKETIVNNKKEIIYLKHENQELKAKSIKQLKDVKIRMTAMKKENHDLLVGSGRQLKIVKDECVSLNNVIRSLQTKFQHHAKESKLLSADVKESKKTQEKLSSAISSLMDFRNSTSLRKNLIKETSVGFTAGVTSSSYYTRHVLVFPHVITNKGQGYSSRTGKFTAPRDGTYVFFVTGVSSSNHYLALDIVHDGVSKVRTDSTAAARFQTGTNLVVLELNQGNRVWVKRNSGQFWTHSVPLTTFSGFLL